MFVKMKRNTSVVFCLTVTLIMFAKTLMENDVKEHLSDFLFLNNSQKFCEGGSIIQALNTEKLLTLNSVLDICASKKECDFVSYSPKRILRNSLFYEEENELNNTGANWFCSGEKWVISRPRKYWITAIKEDHIKGLGIAHLTSEEFQPFAEHDGGMSDVIRHAEGRRCQMRENGNSAKITKGGNGQNRHPPLETPEHTSASFCGSLQECDDEHVLMKIRRDITPKEAATE